MNVTAAGPDIQGPDPIGENISLNQAADAIAWRVLDIENMLTELETLDRRIYSEPKPKNDTTNSVPSDTVMGKLKQLHSRLGEVANSLSYRVIFMRRITATSENKE